MSAEGQTPQEVIDAAEAHNNGSSPEIDNPSTRDEFPELPSVEDMEIQAKLDAIEEPEVLDNPLKGVNETITDENPPVPDWLNPEIPEWLERNPEQQAEDDAGKTESNTEIPDWLQEEPKTESSPPSEG